MANSGVSTDAGAGGRPTRTLKGFAKSAMECGRRKGGAGAQGHMPRLQCRRVLPWLAGLVVAFGVAACQESSSDGADEVRVAVLNSVGANTYTKETWGAIEEVAAEGNAKVTQFDAQNDVAKQLEQFQNVVASDQYDGVIVFPVGNGVGAGMKAAANAGIKVVVASSPAGPDLDTSEPQVEGVSLSVLQPPFRVGQRLGRLTLEACAGKVACRVVYFYGIKGLALDTAYVNGFKQTIAENRAVQIVAYGEGKYAPPNVSLAAMQTILRSTPRFDVVVGADQAMQGAELGLRQAGKLGEVSIIGIGGSEAAVEAIKEGRWFGGVMTAPQTEGTLAMEGMMNLLTKGKSGMATGIDPLSTVTNDGLITQQNVRRFRAQWKG